ncbi:MAG: ribosomal protein S27AE, partial [Gammaproteobacteria bacterium]
EVCAPGTFTCSNCGETLIITETAQIPGCLKCSKTEFYRVVG